ncbi:MAG: F0F1 ATP synthase subunit delta [Leptolyngbyaceae cyanobacterium SL_7_1]|nr:F0F1 ATP synthase subunit delta [Leptolyngbyaceae cyanobacterium SL_7_1]
MKDNLVTTEIVEPYAQALMSLAQSSDLVDRLGEDMGALQQLLTDSEELRQFIATPLVKAEQKKAVLRQVVREQVHPYTLNFLMLLVDRGRIGFLASVARQYQTLLRQLRQTVLAEVISAVELNDGQKDAVRQKVKDLVGANEVELDTQVDPDLIGGVIIKIGSQIFDASLRGQLRRIGFRLASST